MILQVILKSFMDLLARERPSPKFQGKIMRTVLRLAAVATIGGLILSACASAPQLAVADPVAEARVDAAKFEQDRQAILAMTGDYQVSFDFLETVSFVDGYDLAPQTLTSAQEWVRVIEDAGAFISLQHILVIDMGEETMALKHWRQDWQYEPDDVLTFIGGNAWKVRDVPPAERAGKWSQSVYQVDDSPRYGAVGAWSHANGISQWQPPAEWRPLPRRDMTKRDDYHAVDAVNRHAITPFGWVHEQDNSKLVLKGAPQVLVREVGLNTYTKTTDFDAAVVDAYWTGTAAYWAEVRSMWAGLEDAGKPFGLTLKGEPEALYTPVMEFAVAYKDGDMTLSEATEAAWATISEFTTTDLPELEERLR